MQAGASLVGGVAFDNDADATAFVRNFTALQLQILPAAVLLPSAGGQGMITLEGTPLAAASAGLPAADLASAVRLRLPVPRMRTEVVAVLLGERRDGTRVVLAFDTIESPAWHGTLMDWWFGPR